MVSTTQRVRGRCVNRVDAAGGPGYAQSMRVAVLLLGLALVAVVRAEDDDGVLDAHPLGEPIPERLQTLEREWADDVGPKEPVEDPANAAEEPREPSPFEEDAEVETKPHASADEAVVRPKGKSTVRIDAIERAETAGGRRVGPGAKAPATGAPKAAAPEPTSPED
jgi:hypothetical protein